ncbi:MAG: hypothetical protein HYW37_01070 [Candidatus Colwellbacteria bacterium]|nr:hypothetical protein [Candidatus Colwellbacteria bacterium]
MEGIKKLVRKFVKFITPPPIGGLFVGNFAIQYLELKDDLRGMGGVLEAGSVGREGFLRLPPGIIDGGKVIDKPNFVSALREVHSQISGDPKKIIDVVLTLTVREVFVQTFSLPKLAEKSLAQAAELNSRMVSPIPVDEAYFGWQKVGETSADGGQIELLGAFIPKVLVDRLSESLREAGFGVAAAEFSSLSLVRSLNSSGLVQKQESYLAIEVGSYGLNLMLLRNGNLYFDYSYSWSSLQGEAREISVPNLRRVIGAETQKIMNFYSGRFGGQIRKMIVVTPSLQEELAGIVRELFPGIEVRIVGSDLVNPVLGAALRGLTPRVRDFDISLTSVSVAETFLQDQILNFVSLWRSVLLTVVGFTLLVFAASDVFLGKTIADAREPGVIELKPQDLSQLNDLQVRVEEFNKAVGFVKQAKEKDKNISPILQTLNNVGGAKVRLDRIYLPGVDLAGVIVGNANNNESAIEFKNNVAALPQFSDVSLPLGNIVGQIDGTVAFTLSFKVRNLDF